MQISGERKYGVPFELSAKSMVLFRVLEIPKSPILIYEKREKDEMKSLNSPQNDVNIANINVFDCFNVNEIKLTCPSLVMKMLCGLMSL